MIYQTGLELTYTQAPRTMKSLLMSLYLLTISLGNFITACVNYFIQNPDGTSKLEGPAYFLFFTGLMTAAAVAFLFVAKFYKEDRYLQEEAPTAPRKT
jgi:POT family proton-dependent oligopeptide transporter